jgi:hypothetical protein
MPDITYSIDGEGVMVKKKWNTMDYDGQQGFIPHG